MNTTLEQIKFHSPCEDSYKKLLKGLNKTKADSEPLEFRSIYNILDADDVIWATRVLDKKTNVHVGALFADTVKHLTEDKRIHDCIEVCFRYARGEATEEELKNASNTAYAAAYATAANADAATDAAYTATDAAYATADAAYAAAYATAANATNADAVYAAYAAAANADAVYAAAANADAKDKLALIFLTYIEEI